MHIILIFTIKSFSVVCFHVCCSLKYYGFQLPKRLFNNYPGQKSIGDFAELVQVPLFCQNFLKQVFYSPIPKVSLCDLLPVMHKLKKTTVVRKTIVLLKVKKKWKYVCVCMYIKYQTYIVMILNQVTLNFKSVNM